MQRDGLRPQPLNLQQLQHAGPVFLQQLLMQPQLAFAAKLLDVRRHSLADAGNLQQLLGLVEQSGDLFVMRFQRLGGATIGANAKRVVAVDLHQVGGFVEDLRDGLIFQASTRAKL